MKNEKIGRVLKTVGTGVFLYTGFLVMTGKGCLEAIDMADNMGTAARLLGKLQQHGNVNIGSLILLGLATAGAVIITMYIWRRGPFKALKTSSAAATTTSTGLPSPVALGPGETPTIKMPGSAIQASAIGVPTQFVVRHMEFGGVSRFECDLLIMFLGFTAKEGSPSSLSLTPQGGKPELCKMEIPNGTSKSCPGLVRYHGEGDWNAMMGAVEQTMTRDIAHANSGPRPWETMPPGGTLRCNLEIHLPGGPAADLHAQSMVRLAFELLPRPYHPITVRIDPWKSFEESSGSTTLL